MAVVTEWASTAGEVSINAEQGEVVVLVIDVVVLEIDVVVLITEVVLLVIDVVVLLTDAFYITLKQIFFFFFFFFTFPNAQPSN